MVDLHCKTEMVSSDLPNKSPKLSKKLHVSIPITTPFPTNISPASASDSACSAYEHYLRLPELKRLWNSKDFPDWKNEPVFKPALQALEITFRFISTVLSDHRPYANQREWRRRLHSLATSQIQLIALFVEDEQDDQETRGKAPIVDLRSSGGVLSRDGSYAEVWKAPDDETTLVYRTSESSLLPRLATWHKSEDVARKIQYAIECEMMGCTYTLGLGEPNLNGKPNLNYDAVCKPNDLHLLKRSPYGQLDNQENQTLYTTQQILESWIQVSREIIKRVVERIQKEKFEQAASDCHALERIWNLLAEIEDLHPLMDPDDFLRLKNQLSLKSVNETEPFCFRSKALVELTKSCKDLKHKVPEILQVEVDPKGGPRIQEAAMKLYTEKRESEKIHLLQGMQAVEAALKRFFYAYKQVLVVVMGSLEAKGSEMHDSLTRLFLEPTYFPSLDAAKTFLGEFWSHEQPHRAAEGFSRRRE